MRRLAGGVAALGLAATLALSGCSNGGAAAEQQTLTVFAAAPAGVSVPFSCLGSSTRVDQRAGGAPADVLATAHEPQMDRALTEGLVSDPKLFTSNVLALVVVPGNPLGITGLDGSLDGVKLVTCASEVPCGSATDSLSEKLGVTLDPVSREQKVTDVLGKVTSGEADAAVVYVTDAKSAGDQVEEVPIEGAEQVVNRYPIAVTAEAPQPDLAAAFVALVLSEEGQAVLADAGFSAP
ncbi:MAG: molybdate ABC transporter substrate-binding protein [Propioniciclava sp.]